MQSKPMPPTDNPSLRRYWIASYPKSGNTWFRGFLSAMTAKGGKALDLNRLAVPLIASSRSWLDDVLGFDTADLDQQEIDALRRDVYAWDGDGRGPVYHKTHDAFLTPAGDSIFANRCTAGALYIVRNPLDVAPSYAHHNRTDIDQAIEWMGDPQHGLNTFASRIVPQTRQHMGTWSDHVRSWIDAPVIPVHLLRYEDMHRNTIATFTRASRFLELPDDHRQIASACEASSFGKMRALEDEGGFRERPPGTSVFFRRGEVGGWRIELNDRQVCQIIADHGEMMRQLGYLDESGNPVDY